MRKLLSSLAVMALLAVTGLMALKSELSTYRSAFLYAYGPYEFTRSIAELSLQIETTQGTFSSDAIRAADPGRTTGAFLNRQVHSSAFADHTSRSVTTPNNDTLYTSAVLELSTTPVELQVPPVGTRYLSIALMDVFTDQFAHLGPRETQGSGGIFWILGPEDQTPVPPHVTEIRAPGNDVWLLGRTFVAGREDLEAARVAQQGIVVRPVFPEREPKPFMALPTELEDSDNFLAVVREALSRNHLHPQASRSQDFATQGLGPDHEAGALARWLWSRVTPRAETALAEQVRQRMTSANGWSVPPANIGFYGDDDVTRSAIALIGFGALRREDALYFRMTRSENGSALAGTQRYQMIIPPDVPAGAFWSLALYEPDGTGRYFFYETPTGRHSVNSGLKDLIYQEDGSVVLTIGPEAPDGPDTNWLPTPEGEFAAFFRVYLPEDRAITEGWQPPALTTY